MGTAQDKDIAIWVCPHGYTHDVIEFPVGTAEPNAKVCGTHGEPYFKRCPNEDCPAPLYHPSDLDQAFHKPCGARIPWGATRAEQNQVDYEHFNSSLLGGEIPDLTPQERQDLITPPSGRLPAERVRVPESKQPREAGPPPAEARRFLEQATDPEEKPPTRVSGVSNTGSDLEGWQKLLDAEGAKELRRPAKSGFSIEPVGPRRDEDAGRRTWDQLERGESVRLEPSPTLWRRVLKGGWDLLFGSLQNAIGGLLLIGFLVFIAVYFGIRLVAPQ